MSDGCSISGSIVVLTVVLEVVKVITSSVGLPVGVIIPYIGNGGVKVERIVDRVGCHL